MQFKSLCKLRVLYKTETKKVLNFVITNQKIAKLNHKANIFGISFFKPGINEMIENHERVCPALILNHILANEAREIILLVNTCES